MIEPEFTRLREEMVRKQILARGVHFPNVLDAFLHVRRHVFVPKKYRDHSYEDCPLSIGFGQSISQPYIVAFMTGLLKPDNTMRVLEIGTGSGYQTAILSCLYKEVFTIEIIDSLGIRAKNILNEEEYHNINLKTGDGYHGWREFAPFDSIIVTCAPIDIPPVLIEQLADSGRLIIPAGESHRQKLYMIEKINGELKQMESIPVRFVPMIHRTGGKGSG